MKRALHGDHISPGGTEDMTGAMTRREEPAGPLSSAQCGESSCGMLKMCPAQGRDPQHPPGGLAGDGGPAFVLSRPPPGAHRARGRP